MALNFERVKDIDEKTKNIVFGYLRHCENTYLSKETNIGNIPNIIYHICLLFYWNWIEPCKFSQKYRSKNGVIILNENKTVLYKPIARDGKYCWIAIDMDPMENGIHCFRIKVN